ncbi:MAG TPA: hypothetical protein VGL35_09345 [Rhizomicrobium sp.]|jgi:hypothetical protein
MIGLLSISIFSLLVFMAGTAGAETSWSCSYKASDGTLQPPAVFLETKTEFVGPPDDYSAYRMHYSILEDSDDGLIAIAHSSGSPEPGKPPEMILNVIILNKRTGEFRMSGTLLRSMYEDRYEGHCVKLAM